MFRVTLTELSDAKMNKVNDFLKELLIEHPEFEGFYNSLQYKLSVQMIEYMVANHLTEEGMAEKLGLDLNHVLRLTSGDNTIDVSKYQYIINQLDR